MPEVLPASTWKPQFERRESAEDEFEHVTKITRNKVAASSELRDAPSTHDSFWSVVDDVAHFPKVVEGRVNGRVTHCVPNGLE